MATISSIGAGSGLPVEEIIAKLMSIERQPVVDLQTKATSLQAKLSSYGKLQSNISALKDAATKLNDPNTWGANLSSSSDASSVSAATNQASVAGTYAVSVSKLAAAQTITGGYIPSTATTIGQGSLTIELGAWNADNTAFTPTAGKSAVTINIGAGEDSLTAARDKINAAGAGVVASVVSDAQGSRLVLRSANTGASNAFRVSANETAPGPGGGPGLSSLAYDPSNGITTAKVAQYAQSAVGKINGIDVVSESNTVSNVIDGLTVNFNKTTSSDVSISVGPDKDAIKKAINDFATAYNSLASFMKDQTKYTPKSGTTAASSGPLQGDSTAIALQGQLRTLASSSSTLGGSLARFADIGLDPQADGTLKVNAAKLDGAIGNLPALKKMLSGLDSADPTNNGITQRMAALTSAALSFDGTLNSKQTSLRETINRNGNDQDKINLRLTLVEARMRASYTALDKSMAKLTGLQSYVNQQFGVK
ncbi:flagellar hook-associated protein 2 [Paucibacter oligotrophus]|uniref:Flagellar hook-associated protein 2 n=1 Tax=Roseateles oligotrophus TaxID=1769250 RepID=A0A840LA73_9BURK|nr:flagellar filament capping protein FliD [Roseateles oligotrophus]MBB4843562.1 flagellar hook-associated protein 2 [Roseateles oligotrophus]